MSVHPVLAENHSRDLWEEPEDDHAVAVSDHGKLRVRLPGQVTVLLLGSWEAACAS
jgi:hypothetical protein